MNRLPFEISQYIFTHLHQLDKVRCMTVCRKWAQLIGESCLFHTVLLTQQTTMKCITEILQRDQHKAAQVRCLIIKVDNYNSSSINNLTVLLPNLQFFFIGSASTAFERTQTVIQPWKNRIKHLIIMSSPSVATNFLSTNMFFRLNRLTLNANNIPESKLLDMLSNVPSVSYLVLNSVNLSIQGVELIHASLPLLKSLSLPFIKLTPGLLLQNVSPAALVKEYRISFFNEEIRSQFLWLQYATRKYPNLLTLEIVNHSRQATEEEKNYMQSLCLLLFERNADKDAFKGFGRQLKKLTLNTSILPFNFFELLDYTGIQLTYLNVSSQNISRVIDSMVLSQQLKSIQMLELGKFNPLDFKWFKTDMPMLKDVTLRLSGSSYQLNLILDGFPNTLESLELKCNRHYLLGGLSESSYSVKCLTIKDAYLSENFDTFIANHLLSLDTLKFENCYFKEKQIALPNHHLSCFKIQTNVLVITSNDNKETIYKSCRGSDILNLIRLYTDGEILPLYPYSDYMESNSCGNNLYFILRCASIKSVITT